jgi:hypothetical protein
MGGHPDFSSLQLNFLFFLQEIELRKALIPFIGDSTVQHFLSTFRDHAKKNHSPSGLPEELYH